MVGDIIPMHLQTDSLRGIFVHQVLKQTPLMIISFGEECKIF